MAGGSAACIARRSAAIGLLCGAWFGCGGGGTQLAAPGAPVGTRASATAPDAPTDAPVTVDWEFAPRHGEGSCGPVGCGTAVRMAVSFASEQAVASAGLRRVTGRRDMPARFDGGAWIAQAGNYDEWLDGPSAWARTVDRTHGFRITARLAVGAGDCACQQNTPGPGLALDGTVGSLRVHLLPDAIVIGGKRQPLPPTGGARTLAIVGDAESVTVAVDGARIASVPAPGTNTSIPTVAFGQLGCSPFDSRWQQLVFEAQSSPCASCGPNEHPWLAAVVARAGVDARPEVETRDAFGRCLAYAALDHAVRGVIADALERGGQRQRALQVRRLRPLIDERAVSQAGHELRQLGETMGLPGCDPVHDASECDLRVQEVAPVPELVESLKRMLPMRPWADHTVSGQEALLGTAIEMHARAGQEALAALVKHLRGLASPGATCNPRTAAAPAPR